MSAFCSECGEEYRWLSDHECDPSVLKEIEIARLEDQEVRRFGDEFPSEYEGEISSKSGIFAYKYQNGEWQKFPRKETK